MAPGGVLANLEGAPSLLGRRNAWRSFLAAPPGGGLRYDSGLPGTRPLASAAEIVPRPTNRPAVQLRGSGLPEIHSLLEPIMTENQINPFANMPVEEFIKSLDREALYRLNELVVERIKFLDKQEQLGRMARFNVGDRVSFTTNGGTVHIAYIIKMNTKTIQVRTTTGQDWKVSPGALKLL
jgi:hypothetical protein